MAHRILSKQFFTYALYFLLLNYPLYGAPHKSVVAWQHADIFQKSCNLLPEGAFVREDFESEIAQAIRNLEKLAHAEYQPALCKLGDMYRVRTYGCYDQARAFEYYERASMLGSIKAAMSLAALQVKAKEYFKAISCYNKLIAEHERHELHCNVGHIYLDAAQKERYFIKDIDQLCALGFDESVCSTICDENVHDQQLFFALGHFADALAHGIDEACANAAQIIDELSIELKTSAVYNVITRLRTSELSHDKKYYYLETINNTLLEYNVKLLAEASKITKKREKRAKKNEKKLGTLHEEIKLIQMPLHLLSKELAKYTEPLHDH